jgi:hypothetical protein
MTGARPFIISLMVVILGGFLITAFAYNFIKVTNPTSDIFNEEYKLNSSATRMQGSLNNFNEITNKVEGIFNDSDASPTDYIFLTFYGAFEIPKTIFSFIGNGIVSITEVLFNMLGGSIGTLFPDMERSNLMALLIGVLISGVILTGIFLLIKSIRSGESER